MRKKTAGKLAVRVALALMVCTGVSAQIEQLRLPQVAVAGVAAGTVKDAAGGQEADYEKTIPVSALSRDADGYFVFVIRTDEGIFSDEQHVFCVPVEVLAMDDETAAVSGGIAGEVVIAASRWLTDDMRVVVTE